MSEGFTALPECFFKCFLNPCDCVWHLLNLNIIQDFEIILKLYVKQKKRVGNRSLNNEFPVSHSLAVVHPAVNSWCEEQKEESSWRLYLICYICGLGICPWLLNSVLYWIPLLKETNELKCTFMWLVWISTLFPLRLYSYALWERTGWKAKRPGWWRNRGIASTSPVPVRGQAGSSLQPSVASAGPDRRSGQRSAGWRSLPTQAQRT